MDSKRPWERLPTTDAELHTETGSLYPQIKSRFSETLQSSIELPRHVTVIGFPMPDPETGIRGDRALTGVTLARSVPDGFEKALWWDRFPFFPHPVCNTISIGKTNPDSSCHFDVYNVIAAQSTLPQCMPSSAI